MKVLVTGGAGYIGSFMTKALLDKGHDVVVFDSLERGYKKAVDSRAKFIQGDLKSLATLESLFCDENIEAVMHFAGYISVEESTKKPHLYYENNVVGSENLFQAAISTGEVDKFIFSSTAAVYGNPIKVPIPESHPKNPTSPYGKNKLAVEETLERMREDNGISYSCLRYFNASGAALDGSMGENHDPETHLIPNAIKAALTRREFTLFGVDYSTKDGSCVRDYIHVYDLVEAHLKALEKVDKDQGAYIYNVGTGKGYSNREVIEMVKKISNSDFLVKEELRRAGDADTLVADVTKIKKELAFTPQYSDLETIIQSAYKWHKNKTTEQGQEKLKF